MLAQVSFSVAHAASRQFKSGWSMVSALISCFFFLARRSFQKLSAMSSPQPAPVTGGVGSRCLPARAIVRAVTATKHEPGLSPLYRVVSHGSVVVFTECFVSGLPAYCRPPPWMELVTKFRVGFLRSLRSAQFHRTCQIGMTSIVLRNIKRRTRSRRPKSRRSR